MPLFTGFGYVLVRGGSSLARALGANEYTVHLLRKALYVPGVALDPIGTGAAYVHEMCDWAARSGSETGQKLSDAIKVATVVDCGLSAAAGSILPPKA